MMRLSVRRGLLTALGAALVLIQVLAPSASAAEIGRSRGHGTFCCTQ